MALHKPDRIFFGNDLDKNLALIEKYVGEYADLLNAAWRLRGGRLPRWFILMV